MRYGTPYTGSKNGIAKWVIDNLPRAKNFVDVFAGGCAITHAALLSGKYENFIANDLSPAPQLFLDAIHGKYRDEKRWISREDFFRLKDTDAYVKYCWSFGTLGENYLYAVELEPWKKAIHYARVYGDFSLLREFGIETDASRADIIAHEDEYKQKYTCWWLSKQEYTVEELDALIAKCKNSIANSEEQLRQYLRNALKESGLTAAEVDRRLGTQMSGHYFGRSQWAFPTQEYYEKMQEFLPLPQDYNEVYGLHALWQSLKSLGSLESLERLERLESLERLQSLERPEKLESLESLERLTVTKSDYRRILIPQDAVIYCDPPYIGTTNKYGNSVNYEEFYRWCERQENLVVVSEYTMPQDRFVRVAMKEKRQTLSATANDKIKEEGLYVPRAQEAMYWRMMNDEPMNEFYERMSAK